MPNLNFYLLEYFKDQNLFKKSNEFQLSNLAMFFLKEIEARSYEMRILRFLGSFIS